MSSNIVTILDRREFIATAGVAVGVACLPTGLAVAVAAVGETEPQATLADWTIDDMWGVYPRPSEAIGYGRPRGDGESLAAMHPADLQFLA
jgi:hypothetical protein